MKYHQWIYPSLCFRLRVDKDNPDHLNLTVGLCVQQWGKEEMMYA